MSFSGITMIYAYSAFLIVAILVAHSTSSLNADDVVRACVDKIAGLVTAIVVLAFLSLVPSDKISRPAKLFSLIAVPLLSSWVVSLLLVAAVRLESSLAFLKANADGLTLYYDVERYDYLTSMVLAVVSVGFSVWINKEASKSETAPKSRVGKVALASTLPIMTFLASAASISLYRYCLL